MSAPPQRPRASRVPPLENGDRLTREEFERNLFLFREQMRSRKFFIHPRARQSIHGIEPRYEVSNTWIVDRRNQPANIDLR